MDIKIRLTRHYPYENQDQNLFKLCFTYVSETYQQLLCDITFELTF